MTTSQENPTGYISVNQAAAELGVKPWHVVRLIETGQVQSVTLVDAASLREHQENQ